MYQSLMGNFNFSVPTFFISSTLVSIDKDVSVTQVASFQMSYLNDPWVLPSPSDTVEECQHSGMNSPLSATKLTYQAIKYAIADTDSASLVV